jgi:hypothetical protein
MRRYE